MNFDWSFQGKQIWNLHGTKQAQSRCKNHLESIKSSRSQQSTTEIPFCWFFHLQNMKVANTTNKHSLFRARETKLFSLEAWSVVERAPLLALAWMSSAASCVKLTQTSTLPLRLTAWPAKLLLDKVRRLFPPSSLNDSRKNTFRPSLGWKTMKI